MSTDTQLCPRVHIATDHAGLDLSADLVRRLAAKGYEVVDHGPKTHDPQDDYPAFCIRAAQAVITDRQSGRHALGIVLGGSGNGEQIAANKVKGIRAALVWNHSTAVLAREHNDANVVALGARQHSAQETFDLVEAFLQTPFSNDERHARRIGQVALFENAGSVME